MANQINPGHDILEVGQNRMELVDFRLFRIDEEGEEREGIYGINVAKVIEIIKMPEDISETPNTSEFVEGMFNLRGSVVPLVNLPKWMGIAEPDELDRRNFKVIITEFNRIKVGFIVHETTKIRRVSWDDINAPELSSVSSVDSKVTGIIKVENDELLLLLDFESIVDELGFYNKENREIALEKDEFGGNRTVLIIDDSSSARKIVNNALTKEGFKTVLAENGKAALDIVYEDKYKIDAIICDVEMPVMDGYTFTKTLKSDDKYKNIPVIMHSSLSGVENSDKGMRAGADYYVVKFDPVEFIGTIKKVL
ncbi:MAG: chemotaxis protein [Deltaproteobacteria bacterium]|jgi:two-component system chemotaxis response regulator CheV|nr:chemotaxis protein [Deltaproteobacteria bacterium]